MSTTVGPIRAISAWQLAPLLLAVLLAIVPASAQEAGAFDRTISAAQKDLEQSLKELSGIRDTIAAEKLPLTRKMTTLENELLKVRAEFDESSRTLDTRNLDLNNLHTELKARRDERTYLSNLLDEYVRNFESRVHISELQRYRDVISSARMAPENPALSPAEVYEAQAGMVEASLDRLLELVGGATFDGTAVGEDGLVKDVRFALIGPVALFSSTEGAAGLAEQRLGSLEPNMIAFEQPEYTENARLLVDSGTGLLPFDPTLGTARQIEATDDTLVEHIKKGGIVMWPILLLASAAFLVATAKLIQLLAVRKPSSRSVQSLLEAVKKRDYAGAAKKVDAVAGPTGEMLKAGVENVHEPKELVEEVMFEKMLETRLRLQSFLSFVAVSAAAAPLLGLLGTVTGIINTFKLITVYGTGDAKTLSSGISEALITTEFGLIIAIPSLLMHAFLSRKAKRFIDGMEKTAVSFLNRIPPSAASTAELELTVPEQLDAVDALRGFPNPVPQPTGGSEQ
jgi:biopolymer transport protein ExbB